MKLEVFNKEYQMGTLGGSDLHTMRLQGLSQQQ
jgi:hypothetical protein